MAKYTVVVHLVKTFQVKLYTVLYSVHCILLTLLMLQILKCFFTGKKPVKKSVKNKVVFLPVKKTVFLLVNKPRASLLSGTFFSVI